MRSARIIAIGTVAVALVLGTGPTASATTSVANGATGQITCKVNPNFPHDSHGTKGWIVGKSQFWCTAGIDSLTNVIKLQKREMGGRDQSQGAQRTQAKGKQEVPQPGQQLSMPERHFQDRQQGVGRLQGGPFKVPALAVQ
jgi:hypothetical protein